MTGTTEGTPRIVDPGEAGWPDEPRVSHAEVLLYGDQAGPLRLLGQAVSQASDAYGLICKRGGDRIEGDVLDYEMERAYQAYCVLRGVYFELAERAMECVKRVEQANVAAMQRDGVLSAVGGGGATWLMHVGGNVGGNDSSSRA